MLYDLDTRRLLARERAELLAREMRASKQRGRRQLAPAGVRLLLAARRLAARPRLTL